MAGANDLTTIDSLRLVAAIAEPPEVALGESYRLTAIVVDPEGRPADVVIGVCVPDGPCQVVAPDLVGDEAIADLVATGPAPVWIVACVDGSCADPTDADLRDPVAWLQRLPLEGVVAGTRSTRLTELPLDERRMNPVITTAPPRTLDPVAADDVVSVNLVVPGAETAAGLTTAGGFDAVSDPVDPGGAVTLSWFTPSERSDARLYVVVDDGGGGTALWRGSAAVRARP